MADNLPGLPDMQLLLSEAHTRWLRADEISQMLLNHEALTISKEPPLLPCSGSVFFYDRRVTHFYKRDGLEWKKRKDGKTINEAHEQLKVGDIYMLNCYYARGKENPSFQRRCYWMLEPNLKHIVFVHYLDVKITCTSSTLASPAVLLVPSSSLLGLKPDERNELFKQAQQDSTPRKRFKSSCSFSGRQREKPPWGEAHLQLETTQFSFGDATSMQGDNSLSLAISESPSNNGHHLPGSALNLVTAGFSSQEGVGPLENDKRPLLGCLPSVPDTPSAENSDNCSTFASKYMRLVEYPSIVSRHSDDHGFQDTGAPGLGTSPSMKSLEETLTPHFCNIDVGPSDIDEEDLFLSHFAGFHQYSMSDDLEVLLGSIDFGPSDSNEEDLFQLPFPDLHQSNMSDDLQFDEVLLSLWRPRKRWTKVCRVLKFLAVWKAATLKSSLP